MRFTDLPAVTDTTVASYNAEGFGVNAEGQIVPGAVGTPSPGSGSAPVPTHHIELSQSGLTLESLSADFGQRVLASQAARHQATQQNIKAGGASGVAAQIQAAANNAQAQPASSSGLGWLWWAGGALLLTGAFFYHRRTA